MVALYFLTIFVVLIITIVEGVWNSLSSNSTQLKRSLYPFPLVLRHKGVIYWYKSNSGQFESFGEALDSNLVWQKMTPEEWLQYEAVHEKVLVIEYANDNFQLLNSP
jgi:hypothetical protein